MRARTHLTAVLAALVACACGAPPVWPDRTAQVERWAIEAGETPALAFGRRPARAAIGRSAIPKRDTLGVGLRLELGAGESPYDDAPPDKALLPEGARGFSDSLMLLVLEGPILPGLSLEGGLAAIRFQDEPLLDGLREAELAWVSIGIRWRF